MGSKCREARAKYELNDENLTASELKVLSFGLPLNEIEQRNVKVGEFKGEPVFVHTVLCGIDNTKPVLVLVHGYGGSGALFYNIIKKLTKHFKLILIDLIGMGGSSRPANFDADKMTAQQATDYMVDHIEAWRAEMNLTGFYLAAHSFGGYICGHYALKHHQHIKKLLLLSPIGCNYDPEFEALT